MEKYIHYCWFGENKMSSLTKKCIKSWKKYLPDYKIIEWNEKNFNVNMTKFSKKAYEEKKWAFVSDVARIYALKEMGGIYFDTDMMITKEIPKSVLEKDFFVGWESDVNIAVGVLGTKKGNKIIKELFKIYEEAEFDKNDLYRITIPKLLTNLLKKEYEMSDNYLKNQLLQDGGCIYSRDYFYPISSDKELPNAFTENTCMIHYYSGSWLSREEQLRAKFEQVFGRKLGKIILKILVKGKHTIIRLKKILKKILIVLLYPLVKARREKRKKNQLNLKEQQFDMEMKKINTEYIIFYNEDWIGIANATKELFGENSTAKITELYEEEEIEYYAKKILEKNIKLVVFSGFAEGWEKLIKKIKELNKNITIKTIWHGSMCMNIYDYDYTMFSKMFKLLQNSYIKSIAFVKKSLYEFFKAKNYNVELVLNSVNLGKKLEKKSQDKKEETTRIGIYASGDRWIKNFYNQMAAASLIEDCIVDCIPINYKSYEFAELLNLKIKGLSTTLSHTKLLERMSKNDINLYVTFSECAPIIPLESLELGVPCITGNNHHYFEGTELEKYLVIQKVDDINAIYDGIKKCLENKDKIMEEYAKWKEKYNIDSRKSVEQFLKS